MKQLPTEHQIQAARSSRFKSIPRVCVTCGAEFYVPPSRFKQGPCLYCNYRCRPQGGENNANWKGGLHYFNCQICGKPASCKKKVLKHGGGKFCSRLCNSRNAVRSMVKRADAKRIIKYCKMCNKSISVKPSHVNQEGTYCSRICMAKGYAQINVNSNSYSRCKHGKREDLGMYFRSKWEANYARYLNWLVKHRQILRWEYEKDTFEFPIKRGTRFYTPDFKVYELNGTHAYHEIKGWMDAKSRTKLNRMAKYYPNEKVLLIGEKEYKALANQLKNAIANWE